MNAQLSVNKENIANQFDSNELRDLSCAEQTQTSGGDRTCYKSLNNSHNRTRLRSYNGVFHLERYDEIWQRRYVIIEQYGGRGNFDSFCRSRGYRVIVG